MGHYFWADDFLERKIGHASNLLSLDPSYYLHVDFMYNSNKLHMLFFNKRGEKFFDGLCLTTLVASVMYAAFHVIRFFGLI
jgi:hypothetical protein